LIRRPSGRVPIQKLTQISPIAQIGAETTTTTAGQRQPIDITATLLVAASILVSAFGSRFSLSFLDLVSGSRFWISALLFDVSFSRFWLFLRNLRNRRNRRQLLDRRVKLSPSVVRPQRNFGLFIAETGLAGLTRGPLCR
jgi:hypothetical protein